MLLDRKDISGICFCVFMMNSRKKLTWCMFLIILNIHSKDIEILNAIKSERS